MDEEVTATTAARSFSELLNRARYRGESFTIVRGGEKMARLIPSAAAEAKTLGELVALIGRLGSPDPEFGRDLAAVQAAQPPLEERRWDS